MGDERGIRLRLAYNAGSRSAVLTGRRAPAAAMVDCLENAMVYDCGPTATSAGVSSGCVFFPEHLSRRPATRRARRLYQLACRRWSRCP